MSIDNKYTLQMLYMQMVIFYVDVPLICEMGRWGDGEMGRWGDGEMERWGDGEMGRWGDGEMERWRDAHK
jgi:hypothetical protein